MTRLQRVASILAGIPVAVILSVGLVSLSVFLQVGPGASGSWGVDLAAALSLFAAMVIAGTAVRRRQRRARDDAVRASSKR
jgi:hypothetical protein